MEDYVKFANPVPYVLGTRLTQSYLVMYCLFVSIFYALIFLIIMSASWVFKQKKNSLAFDSLEMNGTKEIVIKVTSTLVTLYLTFLQIPFMMLLL